MLRAVLFWPGLVIATAFFGTLVLLTAPFDRRGRISQRYSRLWARTNLWLAGVRTNLAAAGPLAPEEARVFVANHQSAVDVFVLGAVLPGQYRWVVKQELFSVPILGRAMLRAGYVPIDREKPGRSRSSLSRAAAVLAAGNSLVVFPEGSRSADGHLQPFKRGAFALAHAAGSPVVPVAVIGSREVLAPGSYRLHPGTVRVELAPAIPSTGLSQTELLAQARAAIAARLAPQSDAAAEAEGRPSRSPEARPNGHPTADLPARPVKEAYREPRSEAPPGPRPAGLRPS